mgnify:CR=1 FL=1
MSFYRLIILEDDLRIHLECFQKCQLQLMP